MVKVVMTDNPLIQASTTPGIWTINVSKVYAIILAARISETGQLALYENGTYRILPVGA